ncbi:MAG: hypothetical protein LBL66_08035 [Clostridiales bacterium]|jgi:hypothetical protein|nr:hypothetical protein [Clostridiales bacterium]
MKTFLRIYFSLAVAAVWGLYIYCLVKNPIGALLVIPAPIIFGLVFIVTGFGLWGRLLAKLTGQPYYGPFEDDPKARANPYDPIREVFSREHKWYGKLFTFIPVALGAAGIILYFAIDLPPALNVFPIMGAFFFFGGGLAFCSTVFTHEVMQRLVPILFGLTFTTAGAGFPLAIMNDKNVNGANIANIFDFFAGEPWAVLFVGFAMLGVFLFVFGLCQAFRKY